MCVLVDAQTAVLAWLTETFVDVVLAPGPFESLRTLAGILAQHIFAGASIHTRTGLALVNVQLAVLSRIALETLALIGGDEILAGGTVLAGLRKTFVNVDVAECSGEAWLAVAVEGAILIDTDSVLARLLLHTFVYVQLAMQARVALCAVACVVGQAVETGAMHTGGIRTEVYSLSAVGPLIAQWTGTLEAVDKIKAHLSVGTVVPDAVIDIDLTVLTYKTHHD